MTCIATLTLNPTIDAACEVERIEPTFKLRGLAEAYSPGGGGMNVALVATRLGGSARCYYLSGGATGVALDRLLEEQPFARHPLPIAGNTRICFNAFERATGEEYRFVPEGPEVSEAEWQGCLDALEQLPCEWLVASGSLPRGVPADFYSRVAELAARKGFHFVLDSSGEALAQGLASGGVALVKPNERELEALAGRPLKRLEEFAEAAAAIVAAGQAGLVAATLGDQGALLATAEGVEHVPALRLEPKSAVGAGDSFTAAMVLELARGSDPRTAFLYGMAAGSAAVLTPGTDMCRAEDVERLFAQLRSD